MAITFSDDSGDAKPPNPQKLDSYLKAVGLLFVGFPLIEQALFELSGRLCGMTPLITRAVLADMRIDAAMSAVNRVLEARKQEALLGTRNPKFEQTLSADIKYVFAQLGIINGVRNRLTHYGASPLDADEKVITNASRARSKETLFKISVSVTELKKMNTDIGRIVILLVHLQIRINRYPDPTVAVDFAERRKQLPWLYKSPLQGENPDKSRKKPPRRRPQRTPSQG